jgi:hypothetical protein
MQNNAENVFDSSNFQQLSDVTMFSGSSSFLRILRQNQH